MTGAHYVDYCSKFYPEWDSAKLQQLKGLLGVPFDQKIKHLSRGQRIKLAFLSTLPSRPQVLLLDEPFSGLDVETRSDVGGILRDLARNEGLTSLITTHDVEEVEMLANRLVLLVGGRATVDESMSSFMGRHRKVLVGSREAVSISPDCLRLKPSFDHPCLHEGVIEHFCNDWESVFLRSNPGVSKLEILQMPLRSILLAKMFPVE
jgi:ABC-2 type transport system ATP-binding protein